MMEMNGPRAQWNARPAPTTPIKATNPIRVAIAGLGFVTLLEIVSRSRLDLDASYRTLGPVRFRATAAQLAEALIH